MRLLRSLIWLGLGTAVAGCDVSNTWAADEAGAEFFEKQVRPILVARCYECHSGQSEKVQGGLRLDSRGAAMLGGDTGPAVVPGKPQESLLIDAINYGELYQMPPKSKLPAEEIAVLTKWVEQGAAWPEAGSGGQKSEVRGREDGGNFDLAKRKAEHWCWQPVADPPLPGVKDEAWIQQPLDRFILAKLEAAGLSPAAPAERRTLVRRVYFDLVGLPPAEKEGEKGREGERETEYEALVDRLLASPQFGERWGRHWLDLVRYAESRGHEFDYDIPNAFEYRDYVIRALNADVPYDQFVTEHIAGDLLEQPRLHLKEKFNESILGTGFWFLGESFHSPVDIRKDECDRIDNMLDVFSKTFLGMTVACARCHDHKFDAISQADYYALAGYLQSSSYRLARFEKWEQDQQIAAELKALEAKFRPQIAAALAKAIEPRVGELAKKLAAGGEELPYEIGVMESDLKGAKVLVDYADMPAEAWMPNGPMFGSGPVRAGQLVLTGDARSPLEVAAYGAARRDHAWGELGLAEESQNDPGRLAGWLRGGRTLKTPTFTLTSGRVHYLIEGAGYVYAAVDSHYMNNGPLHGELQKPTGGNSDLPTRWITQDLSRYVGHRIHLEFTPAEGEDFRVLMVVEGERPAAPASRANRLVKSGVSEAEAAGVIRETLRLLAADRIASDPVQRDRAALANWLIGQAGFDQGAAPAVARLVSDYAEAKDKLAASIQAESRLCLAMWEGTPVDENLLIRGNHKTVGQVVPRRSLTALEGSGTQRVLGVQDSGSGRLALAKQLVRPANPLVSRVIVNRVWHHLMGRGIVPSVDNFGVLGQEPTHPALLDYLATQFMRDGWSIKRLVRTIMLSSTYRQGSGCGVQGSEGEKPGTGDRELKAERSDPQNLLFHRQNLKRLEGEVLRDAILAVSGQLDRKQFGPSVPVYLTPFMQGRGRPKESGPLNGEGRRSIYLAVRRNFLSPLMLAFDTPIPFSTNGRRNASNVPAQALILMNDPFVAEQARHWARRVLAEGEAAPEERIRRMFSAALNREPSALETEAAIDFLRQQRNEYRASRAIAEADESSWADWGHVMYNLKEFVFVE